MFRIILTLNKLAAIAIVMGLYAVWLAEIVPRARFRVYTGGTLWYSVALMTFSVLLLNTAIMLVTRDNLPRVLRNTRIIVVCTLVGWYFGGSMTFGGYDHLGGLESLFGYWTGGTLGAIVGYGITLVFPPRSASGSSTPVHDSKVAPEETPGDEARSEQAVDP
jgi:hypothetical protein